MESEAIVPTLPRADAELSQDERLVWDWYEKLMADQRLGFRRGAEGWLLALDGLDMSYGETPEVAVGWAYVMSHKSAYE